MKKIIIITLLSLLPISAYSQIETLRLGKIKNGFYISVPDLKFTRIKESFAFGLGFRGGWIINHSFSVGLGWNLFLSNIKSNPQDARNYGMGTYGIVLEYIFDSRELVHVTLSTLIGGGHIGPWHTGGYYGGYYGNYHGSTKILSWKDADGFWLVEPGIDLMMNISRFIQVGAGASYRLVSGVNRYGFYNSDLNNFSLNFIFKFGLF